MLTSEAKPRTMNGRFKATKRINSRAEGASSRIVIVDELSSLYVVNKSVIGSDGRAFILKLQDDIISRSMSERVMLPNLVSWV